MIAVLISALFTTGMVKGDTLSTRGLTGDMQKFYDPPAILLNQTAGSMWEGIVAPVIFSASYLKGRHGSKSEGRRNNSEPQNPADGIKRKSERLRPKK